MIRKLVYRYYCEYCHKSKGTKNAMEIHEQHCTKNPKRVCRMCEEAKLEQQQIEYLLACLPVPVPYDDSGGLVLCDDDALRNGIEKLRILTNGCAACMLSALRQKGIYYWNFAEFFDYDSEGRKMMESIRFAKEVELEEYRERYNG